MTSIMTLMTLKFYDKDYEVITDKPDVKIKMEFIPRYGEYISIVEIRFKVIKVSYELDGKSLSVILHVREINQK